MNKKFKGMIFDFNGVLWWDTELQEKTWKEFGSKLKGSEVTEAELDEHMHGRPNKYFLEYLTDKELSEEEIYKLTQEKEELYRQRCLSLGGEFRLSPGAENYLDFLVEKNIPRTIATASEINNVNFFVESLNLEKWFETCNIIYDNGVRPGKPEPDIYLEAAKILKLSPEDCIVVEDAKSGVIAATRAKIGRVYGLTGSTNKADILKEAGAFETFNSFEEFNYKDLF